MSTQIGTFQPKARVAQPMWPFAILALLVVGILAAIVTASDVTSPRDETTSVGSAEANTPVSTGVPATHGRQLGVGIAQTAVAGTLANTPTELTGGIALSAVAGTLANTPTELTGGIALSTAGAVTNAPAEFGGGFPAERAKQLGTEIGGAGTGGGGGGELCDICWKYR